MKYKNLFTSESVTSGHPDKIADQISDAILDEILKQDENARVACETYITTGLVLIGGEISTTAIVDYQKIVRQTIKRIGYTRAKYGFDYQTCSVLVAFDQQSPDINQGVDYQNGEIGAGDQGIMFGYATNETKNYMPLALSYAHQLAQQLEKIRVDKTLSFLRPDGKTQVTVEYDKNNQALRIDAIVISSQHSEKVDLKTVQEGIKKHVINKVIDEKLLDKDTKYYLNPTGKFIIGGPQGDAGLTGRKIIIDTYGGYAAHGGGAFSGKDYTKVDRSAAYAARYIAKNIVAAKVCDRIQIQLSYAIGILSPISIAVETFNTAKVSDEIIIQTITDNFDLTPLGIIKMLDLKKPIYSKTSVYGHFGKSNLRWEKLDKVEIFKKLLN